MIPKSVRIQDVAREAGVSTATVSRALSSPQLLTEATRASVFAAIQSTGYRINKAARNLRTRQAGAVLVLVPNLGNPFFSSILAGMSAYFGDHDTSILIADTKNQTATGKLFVDYFLDAQVDGMICLDGTLPSEELRQLSDNELCGRVVFACEWLHGAGFPSVRSDNEGGARLAVRHLYDLGHRKIAHVTGPQDNVLTHARREGVMDEWRRLKLPLREDWIIPGGFSLEAGRQAATQIMSMKDRPTAVFCASDQVAFGLMSTLASTGLSVPDDISVVGFDDIELSDYYFPALTTIRQDRHALGASAAKLLLECMRADPTIQAETQSPVIVDVELVNRQSAAPLRN